MNAEVESLIQQIDDKMGDIADQVRTLSGATDLLDLQELANHTRDANDQVAVQESLIMQIALALRGKGGNGTTVLEPIIEPLHVTENGTYTPPSPVHGFSPVLVDVPIPEGYVKPSGSISITSNGVHNVTNYTVANVNVPIPDGYVKPEGVLDITKDGIYDVTEIKEVNVAVGDVTDSLLDGSIQEYSSDKLITVNPYAFAERKNLTSVSLPNATQIGDSAFRNCSNLVSIDLPSATRIYNYGLSGIAASVIYLPLVTRLDSYSIRGDNVPHQVHLPRLETIQPYAFEYDKGLTLVDLPVCKEILNSVFHSCTSLDTLILGYSGGVCKLSGTSAALRDTKIYNKEGYIYVPKALEASYKEDEQWSYFADQIRAKEDWPSITGG